MTTQPNDGGPAFPIETAELLWRGMSLRAYAAIKLRVPDSGIDWLDAMILKAKRDEFAGQALQALLANQDYLRKYQSDWFASASYRMSDAMIAARGQA